VSACKLLYVRGGGGTPNTNNAPDGLCSVAQTVFCITLLCIGEFSSDTSVAMAVEAQYGCHSICKKVGRAFSENGSGSTNLVENFDNELGILRVI
jgi:hypothetical protein